MEGGSIYRVRLKDPGARAHSMWRLRASCGEADERGVCAELLKRFEGE